MMKTKSKISPLRISPVFRPNLGEDQKKKRSSPRFCPFRVLKLSAQVTNGGPCRNFAYYVMLIILSWRPKRGGHGTMLPPEYAPASSL